MMAFTLTARWRICARSSRVTSEPECRSLFLRLKQTYRSEMFTEDYQMNLTQPLPTELQSQHTVRFQDCDPFGHLNNARYIDYFLNAREDQLIEHYDFHIFEHGKETNQNWVVTRSYLAYLYPALSNEKIIIVTRLIHMSESTLVVEAVMFD